MLRPLKAIADKFFPHEEPKVPDEFRALKKKLKGARPKARVTFQKDLKAELRARHEMMMKENMRRRSFNWFAVHKYATVTIAVVLMVIISGGGYVYASPGPKPQLQSFEELGPEVHPSVAPITFAFDQPMSRDSVEQAFSIEPRIDGRFIWDGSQLVHFVPRSPLDPNLKYTVTISAQAKSIFQKHIDAPLEQIFQPINFEILENEYPKLDPYFELQQKLNPLTRDEKLQLKENIDVMDAEIRAILQEQFPPPPPNGELPQTLPAT